MREFIGRNAGIYALFRKGRLYYVGLATALRSRLKAHIKNRHGNSWDSFSIYLTIKDQHMREIEALLLRIAIVQLRVDGVTRDARDAVSFLSSLYFFIGGRI